MCRLLSYVAHDILSTVHTDHIPRNPVRAFIGEQNQSLCHILRRCQSSVRILCMCNRKHLDISRYLSQSRRVRHTGHQGVGRDSHGTKLHRQLTYVRFQTSLGGRNSSIERYCRMAPGAGHRKNPAPLLYQTARDKPLNPVYKTVGHDIHGHRHLSNREHLLGWTDERLKSPKGQRVQYDFDRAPRLRGESLAHLIENLASLDRIGGIDVEKDRLSPGVLDILDDLLNGRHCCLPIEMNTENVHAVLSQLNRRRASESAGGSKNQCPFVGFESWLVLFHRFSCDNVRNGTFKIAVSWGKNKGNEGLVVGQFQY